MIEIVGDPALTDSWTLVIMVGDHEISFWSKDRKLRFLYYRNNDWKDDYYDGL